MNCNMLNEDLWSKQLSEAQNAYAVTLAREICKIIMDYETEAHIATENHQFVNHSKIEYDRYEKIAELCIKQLNYMQQQINLLMKLNFDRINTTVTPLQLTPIESTT